MVHASLVRYLVEITECLEKAKGDACYIKDSNLFERLLTMQTEVEKLQNEVMALKVKGL